MRLLTDFLDYYDHAFDSSLASSPVLDRRAKTMRHRREDHDELEAAGFRVPMRGTVTHLASLGLQHVVVYTDPTNHRGQGKAPMGIGAAMVQHADAYACQLLSPMPEQLAGGRVATSYRLLCVGELAFWLRYRCMSGGWQSNVGEVEIDEVDPPGIAEDVFTLVRCAHALKRPLLAVDFVEDHELLWAVDLNSAPAIQGTPVQAKLRPDAVHAAINARWNALQPTV